MSIEGQFADRTRRRHRRALRLGVATAAAAALLVAACRSVIGLGDLSFDQDAGRPATPESLCSTDGFCMMNPLVTDTRLLAVWGSSASDVWAAGRGRTALHFDGAAWSRVNLPVEDAAVAVSIWGSASDDVWMGTSTGALHWDGRQWSAVSEPLRRIWGSARDDVWATRAQTGDGGQPCPFYHYDGATWGPRCGSAGTKCEGASIGALWGGGPDDVWAVCGTVLSHWEGHAWSDLSLPNGGIYGWAFGTRTDVWWIDGPANSYQHWTGKSWTPVPSGVTPSDFIVYTAWGFDSRDAWTGGGVYHPGHQGDGPGVQHFDGSAWSGPIQVALTENDSARIHGIWGSRHDDVWAVGDDGLTVHWDGKVWTRRTGTLTQTTIKDVWGASASDVWFYSREQWDNGVGFGTPSLLHFDGSQLSVPSLPFVPNGPVWGIAANDAWTSGTSPSDPTVLYFAHWNGTAWQLVQIPAASAVSSTLLAVHGTAHDDVWFSFQEGVFRYDGTNVVRMLGASPGELPSGGTVTAIWALARDDVWVISDGALKHWNGSQWEDRFASLGNYFTRLWGTSKGDVWAIGARGSAVIRWTGVSWEPVGGFPGTPLSISGTSPSDVWVVTNATGGVYHWEGQVWTAVSVQVPTDVILVPGSTARSATPNRVWAAAPGDVWVAGTDGRILRRKR